jgi:hypothetical protein
MYTVHLPSGLGLNFGSTAAVPRFAFDRVRTVQVDRMYSRIFVDLACGAGVCPERYATKRSVKPKAVGLSVLRNRSIPRLYTYWSAKRRGMLTSEM